MSLRTVGVVAVAVSVVLFAPLLLLFPAFGGNGGAANNCAGISAKGTAPNNVNLFKAIVYDAHGDTRLILAMLEGSYLESGWANTATGVGSYGPFQIQDPGVVNQGVTIAQAENPAFATNYMYPRYKDAINTVNPNLWSTNPERAAEQTAYGAERPAGDYYTVRGAQEVHTAYVNSVQKMQQMGLISGSGATPKTAPSTTQARTAANCSAPVPANAVGLRSAVLKAAASQLGVPYVWGGMTPKGNGSAGGFDCSGLVLWSFEQAGITGLPRTSQTQWIATKAHTVTTDFSQIKKAQPGDLVFFAGSDGTMTAPGHIGIYWANGEMIVAPQSGENVQLQPIYSQGFVGITDPFASVVRAGS